MSTELFKREFKSPPKKTMMHMGYSLIIYKLLQGLYIADYLGFRVWSLNSLQRVI